MGQECRGTTKTPLIQKIAKQACITYRVLKSSADGADKQSELISPVTALQAADLKIALRKSKPSSGAAGLQSPPVTYMHICETEVFSMGVFLLSCLYYDVLRPTMSQPPLRGWLWQGAWLALGATDETHLQSIATHHPPHKGLVFPPLQCRIIHCSTNLLVTLRSTTLLGFIPDHPASQHPADPTCSCVHINKLCSSFNYFPVCVCFGVRT
ncbi:unnamed protein product [Pleuronectes platessa]|uniref:Uncharacterized protein n=1 Tax=Pleuronectes platessa TaxID=8262 RepID=A0A9N7UNF5_PLEPL|nr:unnamed protein product [Pleuronectes platessa]